METFELPRFSFSRLGVWDRCDYSAHLSYDLEWTPKVKKNYFSLGSYIHTLMEVIYTARKEKKSWDECWELCVAHVNGKLANPDPGETPTTYMVALRLIDKYVHEFAPKEDQGLTVLEIERRIEVELVTPEGRHYLLEGIIDMLVDIRGKLYLWDHKSGARFWTSNQVVMDPQMTTYGALLREVGYSVFGTSINQFNTYDYKDWSKVTTEKVLKRENTYRSSKEMDRALLETGRAVDRILSVQETGVFRKSLRTDCAKCQFFEPCLMDNKGLDTSGIFAASFKKKEPFVRDAEILALKADSDSE